MGRRPLRIGYINQDFPPEVGAGPARVLELSKHWQAAGADVTVVTGLPNRRLPGRPDGAIPPDYRGRPFIEETWDGIRVLRSWVYASPKRSFVRTAVNNASFMVTGLAHALARAGRFDLVIASSPPFLAHVTGAAVAGIRRAQLVLEIRDLWPDYMVEMGMLKGRWARRALFGLERRLLHRARHVVVVTGSFRRRVAAKGVSEDDISVVPNGVDTERYCRDPEAEPPLADLAAGNGAFTVGYLGNFGAGQRLETVLDAAARLRDRAPEIRFVLAGDGTRKPEVETRAAELGLPNVAIHPPIPKERTPAFYNACDVCLVPLAPLPIFEETVPSKLFEIMACERPVVAGVAGEAARVVEASGAGLVTAPGDADALAEAVLRIRSMPGGERRGFGERGRRYVKRHYDREVLAARYLDQLERIAGRRQMETASGFGSP